MVRGIRWVGLVGLVVLALSLGACAGYTETGVRTSEHQGSNGGDLTVEISKANGTSEKGIEIEGAEGVTLDATVTLAVGIGSYKIELLGENEQVTLTLEARDGETLEGSGQMVTDSFGEASYRVTAVGAENVAYVIEYTVR